MRLQLRRAQPCATGDPSARLGRYLPTVPSVRRCERRPGARRARTDRHPADRLRVRAREVSAASGCGCRVHERPGAEHGRAVGRPVAERPLGRDRDATLAADAVAKPQLRLATRTPDDLDAALDVAVALELELGFLVVLGVRALDLVTGVAQLRLDGVAALLDVV